MRLRFEGRSDDTFGEYAHFRDDYDNCASGNPIVWRIDAGDAGGMYVWGQYSGRDWPRDAPGCWVIGVQRLDDDIPIPGWPLRVDNADNGYSPALVIDAPDDASLTCLNREEST